MVFPRFSIEENNLIDNMMYSTDLFSTYNSSGRVKFSQSAKIFDKTFSAPYSNQKKVSNCMNHIQLFNGIMITHRIGYILEKLSLIWLFISE